MYSHNKNSQPSLYRINDALINATNLVDFFFTIIYYLIVHKGISYKGNYASVLINYMRERFQYNEAWIRDSYTGGPGGQVGLIPLLVNTWWVHGLF